MKMDVANPSTAHVVSSLLLCNVSSGSALPDDLVTITVEALHVAKLLTVGYSMINESALAHSTHIDKRHSRDDDDDDTSLRMDES